MGLPALARGLPPPQGHVPRVAASGKAAAVGGVGGWGLVPSRGVVVPIPLTSGLAMLCNNQNGVGGEGWGQHGEPGRGLEGALEGGHAMPLCFYVICKAP